MTGIVSGGTAFTRGTWIVVDDSGTSANEWGTIAWNTEPEASEPPGTSITVEARAADTESGLPSEQFISVTNGVRFTLVGQFLQVRATLRPDEEATVTPILSDLITRSGTEPIAIDIKPGNPRNSINPFARGVIPVAILGSDDFDVADVDASTLAFGPAGAPLAHRRGPHRKDANHDGVRDLLAHFLTEEAGIAPGDTEACVTGELLEGTAFEGCDSVRTVPPERCGLGFELVLLLAPLMLLRRRRPA
jgi:hypothetical protein